MEHTEDHIERDQGHKSMRPLVLTWAALMALLAVSAGSALLHLGWANTAIGLVIATIKALLVAIIFMRLKKAHSLLRLTALLGVSAMVLLFGLSSADYFTRPEAKADWQQPKAVQPVFGSRSPLRPVGPVPN